MSAPCPRVTVVVPAREEGARIVPVLDRLVEAVSLPCEVLVVVDQREDGTAPAVRAYASDHPSVRVVVNGYGVGPAWAIRYGIDRAVAPVVVVTMADGSDDPRQIDDLVALVERGFVVAAASRYMPGGQQVGGPRVKRMLSRGAGLSLYWFARVGTHDATNSFKAYDRRFIQRAGIESRAGFEVGLELTAKARRLRLPVAEVPTIWLDRPSGDSGFRTAHWLPQYLRWYRFAYGPPRDITRPSPGTTSPGYEEQQEDERA